MFKVSSVSCSFNTSISYNQLPVLQYSTQLKYYTHMLPLSLFLLFPFLLQLSQTQCCLKFKDNKCVECPPKMHLYQDNCLYDIDNCIKYIDGFDCSLCAYGHTYNHISGMCQQSDYLDVLMHHLTALRPEVKTYTYSSMQKKNISEIESTVRLHFLDSKKSDIWFEFYVNINLMIFSLQKESQNFLQSSDMSETEVDNMLKDVTFLFALAKVENERPDLANKTIIQISRSIRISENMRYSITFSKGGNLKEVVNVSMGVEDWKKVLNDDPSEKTSKIPNGQNIENWISPEARAGEQVGENDLNGEYIIKAENKARQSFSELTNAKLLRVFKNQQIPNLIDYYLYFSSSLSYFQVIIKHQPFFDRFYAYAINQLK